MSNIPDEQRPWMITVWPGIGHVAMSAGYYLMSKLGMRQFSELSAEGLFDVDGVVVKAGIAQRPRWPKHRLFECVPNPNGRSMIVCIGEAQPVRGKYGFCEKLIAMARDRNVERVFTFAAMATEMRLGDDGRVLVAATSQVLLDECKALSAVPLDEGHVGGLNGIMLAAAAARGMPGICLLGEMPAMFAQIPYPKPSLAVLKVISQMAGLDLDLAELAQHSEATEHHLNSLVEEVSNQFQSRPSESPEEVLPGDEWKNQDGLTDDDKRRIETLFQIATADRTRAYELKNELDRLGAFDDYEDRFLDLFSADS